jgi:hypothetical protein
MVVMHIKKKQAHMATRQILKLILPMTPKNFSKALPPLESRGGHCPPRTMPAAGDSYVRLQIIPDPPIGF